MAGLGKQIQGGLVDAGRGVTTDVVKGLADMGKQVVEEVVDTGVEGLSGGTVSDDQQTQANDDPQLAAIAAQKEQAARARIAQLQGELRKVVVEKKQREEQVEKVEAERKGREKVSEESSRKKRVMELINKARRGGGTGETAKQKG